MSFLILHVRDIIQCIEIYFLLKSTTENEGQLAELEKKIQSQPLSFSIFLLYFSSTFAY